MAEPNLDYPTLPLVKATFGDVAFKATNFRGQTTLIVPPEHLHRVMRFLHDETECQYNFLSDVVGVDYLNYPSETLGRFAVVYLLASMPHDRRLHVKVFLDPSIDTSGIEPDPALEVDSVTDIWPGAEWPEREVFPRGRSDCRSTMKLGRPAC